MAASNNLISNKIHREGTESSNKKHIGRINKTGHIHTSSQSQKAVDEEESPAHLIDTDAHVRPGGDRTARLC